MAENKKESGLTPRPCKGCGKTFTPDKWHPGAETCGQICSDAVHNKKRREAREKARAKEVPERIVTPDEEVKKKELASIEKKVRDNVGRTRILAELLQESVRSINSADVKPCQYKFKAERDPETMVVLRSDWHPGLLTPSYDLDVFHRRVDLFTEKILLIHDIISRTIPLERLVFIDLGDLLSGQGIYPGQAWDSQTTVMKQIYVETAPEIIKQNLTMLDYFPVVEQHSVPGNHGRTGKEMPDEVNFDTILAQDIWRRFEFVDRVKVEVEWGKFMFVDIYGWRFLCTHGNLVRGWMNIPFYGLINKGMRWKGSLGPSKQEVKIALKKIIQESELTEEEKIDAIVKATSNWDFIVHGHFHTFFNFEWNDFEIIGNGCLPSDDDFAIETLGLSSTPAQQVFGVHPEHGITWRYTLKLE